MALTIPILYTIPSFDSTFAQIFKFNVIGGDQVTGSIITIKNNATLQVVYTGEKTTFRFEHELPANTLQNGTTYQASIQTKNAKGEKSAESNTVVFTCYTVPEFEFSNLPLNNIVTNSSFNFTIRYNQIQGEILNAYIFNLYDMNNSLVSTSGTQYNTSESLPLFVSYLFSGFESGTKYYIECTGITAGGTQIGTGRIEINVDYVRPSIYSYLYLTNNCNEGYIHVRTNILAINGTVNPEPPIFIDNEEIDLTKPGSYVEWNDGYNIDGDFTVKVWGRKYTPNTELFRFSNIYGDIITIEYIEKDGNVCAKLRAMPKNWEWHGYTIFSQQIAKPQDTEQVFIWIRRINNIFDIRIENLGVVV